MATKILIKSGTDAARLAATLSTNEISWTSDTKKLYIGTEEVGKTYDGSSVLLTGYVKPSAGGALAPTDTLNQAIGKLETGLKNATAGGGDKNVQVDWAETSTGSDAFIKGKPAIPSSFIVIDDLVSGGTTNALSGEQGKTLKDLTDGNKNDIALLKKIGRYRGTFPTVADRDAAIATPDSGDYVLIGSAAPYQEYIYDGPGTTWEQGGVAHAPTGVHVVDDLTTGGATDALSAEQGKVIKGLISVSGLSDTTITTPADGELLMFDDATKKWVNTHTLDGGTY